MYEDGQAGKPSVRTRAEKQLGVPVGTPNSDWTKCWIRRYNAMSLSFFKARTLTWTDAGLGSAQIISPVAGLRT